MRAIPGLSSNPLKLVPHANGYENAVVELEKECSQNKYGDLICFDGDHLLDGSYAGSPVF